MTRAHSLLVSLSLAACATLGTPGQGDVDLPTTGAGPFRKLQTSEVHGVAPYLLDSQSSQFREPAVVRLDDAPESTRVALFLVERQGGADVIARTSADDARSFFGGTGDLPAHEPIVVLQKDQPWEAQDLGGPSALRVGGTYYLYYASNGRVGLARSSDGAAFVKEPSAVFSPPRSARAPSVARLEDGAFRMLYASGGALYEAASPDGLAWTELDGDPTTSAVDPVFGPAGPAFGLAPGEKPPFDEVATDDPCLLPRTTPAGRLQFRVLYTGTAADGSTSIGFAARYGLEGALTRNPLAVLSQGKHEAAPAWLEWQDGEGATPQAPTNRSLLYVDMDAPKPLSGPLYRAIGAAVAPVAVTLAAPSPFPAAP